MTRPDVGVMRDLLARVRAAAEPDRDLNVALAVEFTNWCRHEHTTRSGWQDDTGFTCDACGADSWGNKSASGQRLYDGCPAYTASIDAAAALAKQMLPNWKVGTAEPDPTRAGLPLKAWAKVEPYLGNDVGWQVGAHEGFARTVPLAICAALLTALIAAEDRHG